MKMGDSQMKEGFTIIEVVLVLAIAGLIFLMVMIALPALQRAQRDSRRQDDISILLRKIKDYQTNNRGALPSDWTAFYNDYLGDNFGDPANSGRYNLEVVDCGKTALKEKCTTSLGSSTQFPNGYKIRIVKQATCDGEDAIVSKNIRKIAIQYKLENGGIYCANT